MEFRKIQIYSTNGNLEEKGLYTVVGILKYHNYSSFHYLILQNAQLQYDFRSLLDEKEEIVTERDAFKCKSHRLNHELNTVLKGDSAKTKLLDIDALVLENKFLQEKIGNLENELELSKQSTSKYKVRYLFLCSVFLSLNENTFLVQQAMLDTKRKKGIIKLGTNTNSDMFMSHKQGKYSLKS